MPAEAAVLAAEGPEKSEEGLEFGAYDLESRGGIGGLDVTNYSVVGWGYPLKFSQQLRLYKHASAQNVDS